MCPPDRAHPVNPRHTCHPGVTMIPPHACGRSAGRPSPPNQNTPSSGAQAFGGRIGRAKTCSPRAGKRTTAAWFCLVNRLNMTAGSACLLLAQNFQDMFPGLQHFKTAAGDTMGKRHLLGAIALATAGLCAGMAAATRTARPPAPHQPGPPRSTSSSAPAATAIPSPAPPCRSAWCSSARTPRSRHFKQSYPMGRRLPLRGRFHPRLLAHPFFRRRPFRPRRRAR